MKDIDPMDIRSEQEKQLERVRVLRQKLPTEDEIRATGGNTISTLGLAKSLRETVDLLEETLETNIMLATARATIKKLIEPQIKRSKEYLDTHTKPEPHNTEMSRYWLEKGIYGIALEIKKILEAEG